jgi:hypothetical protein
MRRFLIRDRRQFRLKMSSLFPFVWHPKGAVAALEKLAPADGVVQQSDVTKAVSGGAAGAHPLMVTALAGGKIIGDLRLAATGGDVVIGDIQSVFGVENLEAHHSLRRRRFRLPKYREGTALLLGAANSDNYYHWLVDSLPRWKMLQAAGWREYDHVLLHSRPCEFQDETLDWLGVPPERRLRCSKQWVHQFERLVVPAMPFARKTVPTWVAPWLRSLRPAPAGGPEKVYLSRRGVPGRKVANEPELLAALEPLGFTVVEPEKLSVAEQARCLGAARWIVGPHGGALANMVFAPPGACVLEFFHPQHKNRCYENLAAASGHRYANLDGEATEHSREGRLEYRIGVTAVLAGLEGMGLAPHPACC